MSDKRVNRGKSFMSRNLLIQKLGFASYSAYLDSDLWKGIRERVLARDRGICQVCKGPGSQAHHRVYALVGLLGKRIENIVTICRACHQLVEFANDGSKRSVRSARAAYRRLRRQPR